MKHVATIFGFFCILAIVVVFLYIPHAYTNAVDSTGAGDINVWRERIRLVGGAVAYEELVQAADTFAISKQHASAHSFGSALLDVEGIQGLTVCDQRLSTGCYHQFVGDAIAEYGVAIVPEMVESCRTVRNALGCEHGIGHGLLGWFGYDEPALKKALTVCEDAVGNLDKNGCAGGVFMEYNTQTLLGEEAQPRPMDGNPDALCRAVSEQFVPACAFMMPQWWIQILFAGITSTENYAEIGRLCRSIADDTSTQRFCFEGIGTNLPGVVGNDITSARSFCDAASDTDDEQRACRQRAARDYSFILGLEAGQHMCDGLASSVKARCVENVRAEYTSLVQPKSTP